MKFSTIKFLSWLLTTAVLSACGGEDTTNVAEGGIGGTGMAVGTVTEVGSITVNGVRYSTEGARIITDDIDAIDTTGQLIKEKVWMSEGMIAIVEGSINPDRVSGTATRVIYLDSLEGPIQGSPTGNALTVLGQTIVVDDLTRLVGASLNPDGSIAELVDGNVVEVSGLVTATGLIRATYLKKKASAWMSGDEVEIKGLVSNLGAESFTIWGLSVDTTSLTSLTVSENDYVEVKGTNFNVANELVADSVEVVVIAGSDVNEAEIEGIITLVDAASQQLVLGGITRVDYRNAEFDGGSEANLSEGIRVEVEGAIVSGVLVANEIEFGDDIEVSGLFTTNSVDTLTLTGTAIQLKVDDRIAEISGGTVTGMADIVDGDWLEVRARNTASGYIVTRIEWKDPVSLGDAIPISIQGPLDTWDEGPTNPSISLLGITIETQGLAIQNEQDQSLSLEDFYAALTDNPDAVVEVNGALISGVPVWSELELDE